MKTRFAPSPTGYLHRGHVWSAMHVAAEAARRGASVHLRLEDHDRLRCSAAFADAIRRDLEWIGFEWESESLQSERGEIYERYFGVLQAKGLLHELYKTDSPKIMFECSCGDFAVRDALGQWTYQFAVVVDDFEEGIDLVVRGEDLLESVGRQEELARVLGRTESPVFVHHSLVCDSAGKKLSKRDGSIGICREREAGGSPGKVLSEICRLMLPQREIPGEISWSEAMRLLY